MIKFNITISKKEYITKDVIILEATTSELITPKPGQFITFIFENIKGEKFPRSYSLLFNKAIPTNKITLCIRLFETGIASTKFRNVQIGETLTARGPVGTFTYNETTTKNKHIFVGTDTGIVPLYSMIFNSITKKPNDTIYLFFGGRKEENLYFHNEFIALDKKSKEDATLANFTYVPVLSREEHTSIKKGYVQDQIQKEIKTYNEFDWYICGNGNMITEVTEILKQNKLELDKDIFTEKFD